MAKFKPGDVVRQTYQSDGALCVVVGYDPRADYARVVYLIGDAPISKVSYDEESELALVTSANLGCVSTSELLAELQARAEVGGYAEYRTVDNG